MREQLQIDFPIKSLLETPTLHNLAKSVAEIHRTTQKLQVPVNQLLGNRVEIEL